MKIFKLFLISSLLTISGRLYSQAFELQTKNLTPVNVNMSIEKLNGKEAVKVIEDSSVKVSDAPTFVRIKGADFKNGAIEVKVLSRLLKNAPASARGFIGIAFRVNNSNTQFEGIYIRPTNGRADDQLRRNHSTQYFSYPGYDFDRLRKEAPGQYESYADMGLDEWIDLKIVVLGNKAKLFINNSKQPVLIVNDLKLGENISGAIGFWVGEGTEGYFSDLKISN
jgi:hypothetical protein